MASKAHFKKEAGKIYVRDNNVDQALRVLKKKMQREGVFSEFKRRAYYESPSEKRKREGIASDRRRNKLRLKKEATDHGMSVLTYKAYKKGRSPR